MIEIKEAPVTTVALSSIKVGEAFMTRKFEPIPQRLNKYRLIRADIQSPESVVYAYTKAGVWQRIINGLQSIGVPTRAISHYLDKINVCDSDNDLTEENKETRAVAETAKKRNVPFACIGMRVWVKGGNWGTIVGVNVSGNFSVLFDDYPLATPSNVHPNWEIEYYSEDGTLIQKFN